MRPLMLKRIVLTLLIGSALSGRVLHADTDTLNSETGVIHIMVENEDGSPAPDATIYISDGHKIVDIVKTNSEGSITVMLQQGNYLITSTQVHPVADALDRFASH